MKTCRVSGSSCRIPSTIRRIIVGDCDGGLVLGQWGVAQKKLIDSREQERRIGKKLLPILARKYCRGAGDSHDQVRLETIREGGSDVVDDRLFRRDDEPCRAHDDLDDVHGSLGDLVEVYAEVAGEIVERHVAAIERLQHQDLSDGRLRFNRGRTEHQQTSQRHTWASAAQARLTQEAQYRTHQVFGSVQEYTSPLEP